MPNPKGFLILFAALLFFPAFSQAQLYKCIQEGKVSFSDKPCPAESEQFQHSRTRGAAFDSGYEKKRDKPEKEPDYWPASPESSSDDEEFMEASEEGSGPIKLDVGTVMGTWELEATSLSLDSEPDSTAGRVLSFSFQQQNLMWYYDGKVSEYPTYNLAGNEIHVLLNDSQETFIVEERTYEKMTLYHQEEGEYLFFRRKE